MYVEGGAHAIAGVSASVGKRDQPARLSTGDYYARIVKMSSHPTMFYDVEDRRGWLIDGASALLHLVRASIHQDSQNPVYRSNWLFNGALEDNVSTRRIAIETLTDLKNLNQALFLVARPTDNGQMEKIPYYFNQRVREILDNFEVLADYDTDASFKDGYWIRQPSNGIRKNVLGFDFWDLAKAERRTPHRAHDLRSTGHGWADYIRSIRATTLFGGRFGELLKAASPSDLCRDWRAVPVGVECLAVSVSTLKAIQKSRNAHVLAPGEITNEITWSSRLELFSPCSCISTSTAVPTASAPTVQDHSQHNPTQLLLPKAKGWKVLLDVPKIHYSITLNDLEDSGAVLFGHTPYRVIGTTLDDNTSQQRDSGIRTPENTTSLSASSTGKTLPSSLSSQTGATQGSMLDSPSGVEGVGNGATKELKHDKISWFRRLWSIKTGKVI